MNIETQKDGKCLSKGKTDTMKNMTEEDLSVSILCEQPSNMPQYTTKGENLTTHP
jgi:hypothetical protein